MIQIQTLIGKLNISFINFKSLLKLQRKFHDLKFTVKVLKNKLLLVQWKLNHEILLVYLLLLLTQLNIEIEGSKFILKEKKYIVWNFHFMEAS